MISNFVGISSDFGCQFSVPVVFKRPTPKPLDIIEFAYELNVHADSRYNRQIVGALELEAGERAPQAPEDRQGVPLERRVKGFLLTPAAIGEAEIEGTWAYEHSVLLIGIAVACAVFGLVAAWAVYQRKLVKPFEPEVLAKGWYYDQAVTWFMGNPGRKSFELTTAFDENVVDGAVDGSAVAVRETAEELRKGQTGYVRQYAALVGIGAVLLLAWFVVVRGGF